MHFEKNLQNLRKKYNLSQHDLAEKLDVSRQTISKWESASASPDVDKLAKLSDLFNISIDELIRGKTSVKEAFADKIKMTRSEYENSYKRFAHGIAFGLAIILFGLGLSYFFKMWRFNYTFFYIGIFIGIFTLVYISIKESKLINAEKPNYTKNDLLEFKSKYSKAFSTTIAFIITGMIIVLVIKYLKLVGFNNFIYGMLLTLLSFTLYLYIYYKILYNKYKVKDVQLTLIERRKKFDKICTYIMLGSLAIYLLFGLFGAWHPTWLIFFIGITICTFISITLDI